MTELQICDGYKSWKPSLGIFLDLFSVSRTSLEDARDQALINLRPQV